MADRTFNGVDERLYDEFKLSKLARLLLAFIIPGCPNPYGIYDPSREYKCIDWFDGIFDRQQLIAAFEELISRGILRRFRDGECLWLVKKFKREIPSLRNPNGIKAAVLFLRNYPEIEADFWATHGNQFALKANQFDDVGNWLAINWTHGLIGSVYPEPEPEPEPEPTKNQQREAQLLPLAKSCIEIVAKARKELAPVKQDEAKSAKMLRLAIDSDKIPEADILPLAEWMFSLDNPQLDFNLQNLSVVHNWRNKWRNGVALVVRHTGWKPQGFPQSSNGHHDLGIVEMDKAAVR